MPDQPTSFSKTTVVSVPFNSDGLVEDLAHGLDYHYHNCFTVLCARSLETQFFDYLVHNSTILQAMHKRYIPK